MKLNKVIRTRRQALGLTQEQLAQKLGVSAPAVNKWERNLNYPDITLLPVLARTLGVDLNTLLSFQEDLTDQEIGLFLNQLYEISQEAGCGAAFQLAGTSFGSTQTATSWPTTRRGCWRASWPSSRRTAARSGRHRRRRSPPSTSGVSAAPIPRCGSGPPIPWPPAV